MDQQKTGSFLKELRKAKNLTQEQVGEELNVSGRTVSRWETGRNMPDISLLTELAEFYEVSISEIIDGKRKNSSAETGVEEVTEKMSDYADAQKERYIKYIRYIRQLSIAGLCALVVCALIKSADTALQNVVLEKIDSYCKGLVSVSIFMIYFYTSCIQERNQSRKKRKRCHNTFEVRKVILSGIAVLFSAVLVQLLAWQIWGA